MLTVDTIAVVFYEGKMKVSNETMEDAGIGWAVVSKQDCWTMPVCSGDCHKQEAVLPSNGVAASHTSRGP